MHLKNIIFKLFFYLIFILCLKSTFILSSVILDRSRLNDHTSTDNVSPDNVSTDNVSPDNTSLISSNNTSPPINSSIDSSIHSSSIKSSPDQQATSSSASNNSSSDLTSSPSSNNITTTISATLKLTNALNQSNANESKSENVNVTKSSHLSDLFDNQQKLIQHLVKEEKQSDNENQIRIAENLLNEHPSTNNILTDEMINDYRKMNNSYEFKSLIQSNESLITKNESLVNETESLVNGLKASLNDTEFLDNFDLKLIGKVNETLINDWIKENENAFDLYVSDSMDCMFVRSEDGVYSFYSSKNHTDVCALYLITDPNKLIEFEFLHFNVSCGDWNDDYPKNNQSLVSVVDGWEIKGEFFPGKHTFFSISTVCWLFQTLNLGSKFCF